MSLFFEQDFFCPCCGSANSISLEGAGKVVVDCEVCCRPIVVSIRRVGGEWELDVRAENGS